ncbi:MAG: BREX system P-loop protein BrxC, partial [Clostridia bacterium]|nr:BREX system P-loop protein BrxC [Clostridia bacterium]
MSILNKDLFLYNPETRKLVNEGVANVNDNARSSHDIDVLRYELETFVCDGQYEHGLQIILESFLGNIGQAEQPSAWVSGFFGSGKSHLVKMLRALWVNTRFPDGATAQGIASLPDKIRDLLKELEGEGKRYGGLHAASGTLGAGANGSVRLSLLQIAFRSVNLPEQYPIARFVMWMRDQGILDSVRQLVEADGCTWENELDSF